LALYLISENSAGKLATPGAVVKNNVKNWLNQFKSMNDSIEIMDPYIINFGVDFTVVVDQRFSPDEVIFECIEEIKSHFTEVFYIGEPIYITRIYDKLNRVDGVVDTRKVEVHNKSSGVYSTVSMNFDKILSKDGTYIETPKNAIMELKFPDLDIKGTAK
jgi:hypothetical protein